MSGPFIRVNLDRFTSAMRAEMSPEAVAALDACADARGELRLAEEALVDASAAVWRAQQKEEKMQQKVEESQKKLEEMQKKFSETKLSRGAE